MDPIQQLVERSSGITDLTLGSTDMSGSMRHRCRNRGWAMTKVGIPNFVSGPGEYIMEGESVILKITVLLYLY